MGLRHSGREAAVKVLYSMEFSGNEADAALADYWINHKGSVKYKKFTLKLVTGITDNRIKIDEMISSASKNWPIGRIAEIDKKAEEFEGYFCLFTTDVKMSKFDMVSTYFDKDLVEKAFRSLKGVIKGQTIRHWLHN